MPPIPCSVSLLLFMLPVQSNDPIETAPSPNPESPNSFSLSKLIISVIFIIVTKSWLPHKA